MKLEIFCLSLLLGAATLGCSHKPNQLNPTPTPVATVISPAELKTVQGLSSDALIRRAKVGELGACSIRAVNSAQGCANGAAVVYLLDQSIYFPGMANSPATSAVCAADLGAQISAALKEGFCFDSSADLTTLSDAGFVHRASAKELGECILKDLAKSKQCQDGPAAILLLADKNVYYPAMTTRPEESAACKATIGATIRAAQSEGFCLKQ